MSSGYVGGLNFYGVKHLVFTEKGGQITLTVYSDRDILSRMFILEFHPEYGTGVPIEIDLPPEKRRVELEGVQS